MNGRIARDTDPIRFVGAYPTTVVVVNAPSLVVMPLVTAKLDVVKLDAVKLDVFSTGI